MRKTNKTFSAVILCLSASSVYAEDSSKFYLELFGGIAESIMGSPDAGPDTSGISFIGHSRSIDLDYNGVFGVRSGYIVSDNFRFDISYYDASSQLDWMTDFPGCCTGTFAADIDSKILLVSAYYNFTTNTDFHLILV